MLYNRVNGACCGNEVDSAIIQQLDFNGYIRIGLMPSMILLYLINTEEGVAGYQIRYGSWMACVYDFSKQNLRLKKKLITKSEL